MSLKCSMQRLRLTCQQVSTVNCLHRGRTPGARSNRGGSAICWFQQTPDRSFTLWPHSNALTLYALCCSLSSLFCPRSDTMTHSHLCRFHVALALARHLKPTFDPFQTLVLSKLQSLFCFFHLLTLKPDPGDV